MADMTIYKINPTILTNIANAIRSKLGTNITYAPNAMAAAINSITFQKYYTGTSAPSSSLGNDGDIYIQT